jgi:hypothetical protein
MEFTWKLVELFSIFENEKGLKNFGKPQTLASNELNMK